MRLPSVALAAAGLLLLAAASTASGQPSGWSCPVPPGGEVSLVLSGGGSRGLAHVGVLRVLDSIGVRPTSVVGTSMGALVGSLYASGFSGRQLDSLARDLRLEALFGPYLPRVTLTAGELATPVTTTTPTFVVEQRGGSFSLRSPVAREAQLNTLLNRLLLRANLQAAGNFDRLPRRFRAVATDLETDSAVVIGSGDLAEAVRASIAIPLVFSPVARDGRVLIDGGLSANVPVDAARALSRAPVVISDVGGFLVDSAHAPSTATLVGYLLDELFTQPAGPLAASDVRITPETQRFLPLDFSRTTVDSLIEHGYAAAREAFGGCAPALGGAAGEIRTGRFADEEFIADRLARVVGEAEFESVWLRPSPALTDTLDLAFDPIARPAPDRVILGGVVYDAKTGAELWLAPTRNSIARGRVSIGGSVVAGESRQQLTFSLTTSGVVGRPVRNGRSGEDQVLLPDPRLDLPPWSTIVLQLVRPELTVSGSREIIRLHDARGRERARTSSRDAVFFLGAIGNPTPTWQVAVGPVAHAWRLDRGALTDARTWTALGGLARAARVVATDAVTPLVTRPSIIAAEALWLDRYWRVGGEWDTYAPWGRHVLRRRAAVAWSEHLPMSRLLVVGGSDGFPGLHRDAWRATRSASVTFGVLRRITGPVSAYADAGGAWTSLDLAAEPLLLADAGRGSLAGAEVGITAGTPIGAVMLGYGRTTRGSSVVRIRLGR